MGGGVARIEDHGAFEVRDGAGHYCRVERFQSDATLGERLIGLETARFAIDPALGRPRPAGAERVGKLADDAVLEVEDLVERAVGLGVREALAALGVDDPGGDAQAVAGALEAADHRAVDGQRTAQRRDIPAGHGDGLGDAKAIDDAQRRGAQIVGQGLGDARRQPGERGVAADVLEVEHRDRRGGRFRRIPDGSRGYRGGRDDRFYRRDETVAAAGDGLDVCRVAGIVAERLTQLGYGLRQGVVGDGDVGPQGPEQIVLRDEHRRPRRQEEQQVDDLRRERDIDAVAQQPVCTAVDDERSKPVRGGGGHGGDLNTISHVQRATVLRCHVLTRATSDVRRACAACHVRRATCDVHGEPQVAARGTALRTEHRRTFSTWHRSTVARGTCFSSMRDDQRIADSSCARGV